MATQNVQNYIPLQPPVQSCLPVQNFSVPQAQMPPAVQQVPTYPPYPYPYCQIPKQRALGQTYSVPISQQQQQTPKNGSVGTVNITINGVNAPGQQQTTVPQCYPSYVPYYVPQYISQKAPQQANIPAQEIKKEPTPEVKPELPAAAPLEKKPEEPKTEQPKPEEKKEKQPAVALTNEYIKLLEKNLNNKDKTIRSKAVAELVKRFKEDESRKDNPALTNLLNLALQDESKPIVFAAMQALENDYANGNDFTVKLLQEIQAKQDKFGNSDTAEGLLTKIAGKNIDANKSSASTPIKENSTGNKLNLIAE